MLEGLHLFNLFVPYPASQVVSRSWKSLEQSVIRLCQYAICVVISFHTVFVLTYLNVLINCCNSVSSAFVYVPWMQSAEMLESCCMAGCVLTVKGRENFCFILFLVGVGYYILPTAVLTLVCTLQSPNVAD